MSDFVLLQPLLDYFKLISSDGCWKILSHLKRKDLIMMRLVCRSIRKTAKPYFSGTIVCSSDSDADSKDEFHKYCVSNQKFLRPFLHQKILFVKPGDPWKTQSPLVAIFTTNGRIPKKIDTSQLRSIGHFSKKSLFLDSTNPDEFGVFDFLKVYREKLTQLLALTICNGGGEPIHEIHTCPIIPQIISLKISGFVMEEDDGSSVDRRNECGVFPLKNLKELSITIEHSEYIDLPDFYNLEKFILHLTKPNYGSGGCAQLVGNYFRANGYPWLKSFELFCDSQTLECHAMIDLSNTSCLKEFICNATPKQARFTVFGTEDANGAFIPGNDDWVKNLTYIEIRPDFCWYVETSKRAFKKRCFKDVTTLQEDVVFEHFDVETEDPPSDVEIEKQQ